MSGCASCRALRRESQGVAHSLFFRLQVDERMRRRADLAGKPFDDLDAAVAERAHLAWVIGQQANAWNAKVVEDRGRQAEVPEIRLEPERVIRSEERRVGKGSRVG